jgi:hypothetical protein
MNFNFILFSLFLKVSVYFKGPVGFLISKDNDKKVKL